MIKQCRLGDQPSSTKQQDDRMHLCGVIACMIKLDKLCKEIAEWEGWDAEEYKAKKLTEHSSASETAGSVYSRT